MLLTGQTDANWWNTNEHAENAVLVPDFQKLFQKLFLSAAQTKADCWNTNSRKRLLSPGLPETVPETVLICSTDRLSEHQRAENAVLVPEFQKLFLSAAQFVFICSSLKNSILYEQKAGTSPWKFCV